MARILQVCNSAFYLNRFLAPLIRELVRRGHEVTCVCEGAAGERDLLAAGVRLLDFQFPKESSPAQFVDAIGRMRSVVREGKFQCVDSHNRNASIVARVAAWLEQVPVNLYTAHGFYFHDDQRPLQRFATVRLEALLAKLTDYTLSQSAEDLALMTGRGSIRADRAEHIGNGIDTRRFRPLAAAREEVEASLGLPSGRFRIASTGRLVRGKGFGDLLEAVAAVHARHAEVELLLIGGNIDQDIDPFHDDFLADCRARGMEGAVHITGITHQVERYLATADVFVLPSYREGLPRSLLEGMSMGLPAIATNIRGCREVIQHGVTGLLFEPHDSGRLAALLEDLYRAPELRDELGKAGRQRILDAFDEGEYVRRQVTAIERLVGKAAEPRRQAAPASARSA